MPPTDAAPNERPQSHLFSSNEMTALEASGFSMTSHTYGDRPLEGTSEAAASATSGRAPSDEEIKSADASNSFARNAGQPRLRIAPHPSSEHEVRATVIAANTEQGGPNEHHSIPRLYDSIEEALTSDFVREAEEQLAKQKPFIQIREGSSVGLPQENGDFEKANLDSGSVHVPKSDRELENANQRVKAWAFQGTYGGDPTVTFSSHLQGALDQFADSGVMDAYKLSREDEEELRSENNGRLPDMTPAGDDHFDLEYTNKVKEIAPKDMKIHAPSLKDIGISDEPHNVRTAKKAQARSQTAGVETSAPEAGRGGLG